MSFILDALKKADEARHPTAPSSLGKIRIPRLAPRQARWPWVLGGAVLLALNAGVITYVLWPRAVGVTAPALDARPDAPASPTPGVSARAPEVDLPARPQGPGAPALPASAPPAPRVAPAAPSEVRTTTLAPGQPVTPIERPPTPARPDVAGTAPASPVRTVSPPVNPLSQKAPALAAPPSSRPVAPTAVPPTPPPSPPPAAPATVVPTPPPVALAPSRPGAVAPTRAATTAPGPPTPAAPGGGADEISKLKLTVHVWADKPTERLVFINGRKYVQGDRIEDKAVLEEITQEGALVSYQGTRSLLRP